MKPHLVPRVLIALACAVVASTLSGRAQINVNSDRWMQDSDHARLVAKERDLLQQYDDLDRASEQIAATIDELRKKLTEVEIAKKNVRAELNSVKLKLL